MFNPATTDATGITIDYTTEVSFVKLSSSTLAIKAPLTDFYLLGDHTIGLKLTATQGTSKEYTMKVIVTNTPPYFTKPPETPI